MAVIDVTKLVAQNSVAPEQWQAPAPKEMYFRAPVARSADLDRVLALPRRVPELDGTPRAEAIIDVITERYTKNVPAGQCRCAQINPDRHAAEGCITRLRLLQAIALRELGIVGGLLGPIGVGHGKTLIDLLAPFAFSTHAEAHGMPHGPNILCVLLVPPGLVKQLADDYDYVGQHFHMPTMVVQGAPHLDRAGDPGAPKLQVMPYSRICRGEATSWLNQVQPHAIIADECHKLRDLKTATTARVRRFMDEHPWCRFAGWSGSMTARSIRDYAHLSDWALRNGSPLPRDMEAADDWARTIDPSDRPADPGPLLEGLIATGCCGPGDTLYKGFHKRLTETIGVVSSTAPAVDCELELKEREAPRVPPHVQDLIDQALDFVRPDGEEFATALQAVECACQLACGFHYRWIFPHNEFPRDNDLVYDWLEKRKRYHKELRYKLKDPTEHLDSPQLCEYAAQRALGLRPKHKGLPEWASKEYLAWYEVKPKVKPESDPVRVDDYLVRNALDWAINHHGVIWYQHAAVGEWLHEMAAHNGYDIPIFGGGKDAKLALLGDSQRGIKGENGSRSVICSIKAHGTGTNGLQFNFWEQLFLSNPGASDAWEQTLGRLHRAGQRAPKVTAAFYMHTREMRKHVLSALRSAMYVEGTMGAVQKLRLGMGFPMDFASDIEDEIERLGFTL